MAEFKKAARLEEVAKQATLEPLPIGDERYVDISAGRGTTELKQLRIHLEDQSARDNRFAKVAFTGHRGCGKSTELLRLEHRLAPRFATLHLYHPDNLLPDYDYTDLLLWLVEAVARKFADDRMPLNQRLVDDVVNWFADRVLENIREVRSQIQAETEAEAKVEAGFYWASLRMVARLKSMIQGNIEQRQISRRRLQNDSDELIRKVNLLLDNAQEVLGREGKEPDLLIVQDNLDRLTAEVARRLFCEKGDLLKALRAHVVFTVPIAMVLAPWNIGAVFENSFSMPMVRTCTLEGRAFAKGLDALVDLVAGRVDVDRVFASKQVARQLARMSGGSVRDLVRLLNYAQLAARVDDKKKIDMASANEAGKKVRLDFERLLIPGQVYFPLLAQVHRTKGLRLASDVEADPAAVQSARDFFSELLIMGAVLEYNGDRTWYDVHPIVQEIEAFKDACAET